MLANQILVLKAQLVHLLPNSYPLPTGGFLFLTSTYFHEHFQIYRKVGRIVNSQVSKYEFPIAAITNDKRSGLKEHKCIVLLVLVLRGLK